MTPNSKGCVFPGYRAEASGQAHDQGTTRVQLCALKESDGLPIRI